jgi:integration host factor subunit alpha
MAELVRELIDANILIRPIFQKEDWGKTDVKELSNMEMLSGNGKIVKILLELIKNSLESGEDIFNGGFGKFCVTEKKERKGLNPATRKSMMLNLRKTVTFKCSGKLREKVNSCYIESLWIYLS